MWCTGLVAPWHVGSSRTRVQTRVRCIGRQILNHCTTREVPRCSDLKSKFFPFYPPLWKIYRRPREYSVKVEVTWYELAAQMFVIDHHLPPGSGRAFTRGQPRPSKTRGPWSMGHPVLSLSLALLHCLEQSLALISSVG